MVRSTRIFQQSDGSALMDLSEHHQVRELTWLNGAFKIFLKGRVRPIYRATMDSFLQGDTLICTPNVALMSVRVSCDCSHIMGSAGLAV